MPKYQVTLEITIHSTVEVEADDEDGARSIALDMTESPGTVRLDWDDEEAEVRQVRDESGEVVWDVNW